MILDDCLFIEYFTWVFFFSEGGSWESWDVRASCVVDLLNTLKKEDIIAQFFVNMLKVGKFTSFRYIL